MRRYSVLLLIFCTLLLVGLELCERYWLPHIRVVDRRLRSERTRAQDIRQTPGGPSPILIVGNSLLKEGLNVYLLRSRLRPEYSVVRYVVEDTNYLDWYFGLQRLFREGARPKAVILVLNARQLTAQGVHGDPFARLLMDPRDVLAVKRTIASDNTVTSNLLFASFSQFYGLRTEIHKWFLLDLIPDFPDLADRLRPAATPLPSDEEIDKEAAERLDEIARLCSRYNAQFGLVVPPSTAARDGSAAIQSAANRIGVQVFVPFQPQQLPPDLYSDGFHLNGKGAGIFTDALVPRLRQFLDSSSIQASDGSLSTHRPDLALSAAQSQREK